MLIQKTTFISHVHKDKKIADEIIEVLCSKYTRDEIFCTSNENYGIKPGERWLESMEGNLGNCKLFLVICTADSINACWIWYKTAIARKRHPEVIIIPIISQDLNIQEVPIIFSEFQSIRYDQAGTWKEQLLKSIASVFDSTASITQPKPVYNWERFNSSLEKINTMVEQKIINISPSTNPRNYKNIFERLIKEGELVFYTNDEGYINLTRYNLPSNLMVQLLGAGYVLNRCIYYMRFISNDEFKKLLTDPRCRFL